MLEEVQTWLIIMACVVLPPPLHTCLTSFYSLFVLLKTWVMFSSATTPTYSHLSLQSKWSDYCTVQRPGGSFSAKQNPDPLNPLCLLLVTVWRQTWVTHSPARSSTFLTTSQTLDRVFLLWTQRWARSVAPFKVDLNVSKVQSVHKAPLVGLYLLSSCQIHLA